MNFFSKDKKSKSDLLKKKRAANGYGVGGKGKTLGGKATPGKFVSPLIFAEAGPLGMSIEENDAKNAVIASTVPGGMAESIGILRGDVICWSGSGSSGDDHDPPDPPTFHEFMAVVKEGSRPLEIGVLRIELSTKKGDRDQNTNTNTNTVSSSSSATAEMRKKQMVAAAEQRQSSLNKNFKTKTGPKQGMGSVARVNTNLTVNHLTGAEFGEETKRAVEKIKQKERASAKELGYNPYDTVKKSTGSGAVTVSGGGGGGGAIPTILTHHRCRCRCRPRMKMTSSTTLLRAFSTPWLFSERAMSSRKLQFQQLPSCWRTQQATKRGRERVGTNS